MTWAPLPAVLAGSLCVSGALAPGCSQAAQGRGARAPVAGVARVARGQVSGAAHAPSAPPLLHAGSTAQQGSGEGAGTGAGGEADPLVANGLASPSCEGALGSQLAAAQRSNCATSGFLAAPAPTGDYGIDVHIDTGLLGFGSGGFESAVQNLLVTPLWMALVWSVHALVVMVEWCFTIDLLDSPAAGQLAAGLRSAQRSFTAPWLGMALAVAGVLVAYRGIVRRGVADALTEALIVGVMTACGMWVMADPSGTVGALGQWANQAGLGTLAVAASGAPGTPARTLGASLDTVFATAVDGPWCYLEFGDVGWCEQPARLDPALRRAALAIATEEQGRAGCAAGPACASAGASAQALQHSAQLLREAHSNGAVFLALPANGPDRNAISREGSLLKAICQGEEATDCHGPAAAQAEFRTGGHTMARLGGLLLIAAGLLGMILLLGFLAARLLAAAVFSLLFLLLAPAAVLTPAFGESGRELFRRWAGGLLGSVVSKLLFSFLLGAVLGVLRILSQLTAIGWWTQWLLMSSFWWTAFLRRNAALASISTASGRGSPQPRSLARRAGDLLETRKAARVLNHIERRRQRPAPETRAPLRAPRAGVRAATANRQADTPIRGGERVRAQAERMLRTEHRHASSQRRDSAQTRERIATARARLQRISAAQEQAHATGDRRRAALLQVRAQRVDGEVASDSASLAEIRRAARGTAGAAVRDRRAERERFLDRQASLPARGRADASGRTRDYRALAALAGHAPREYVALAPRAQREARLQIDRELNDRSSLAAVRTGRPAQLHPGRLQRDGSERALPRPASAARNPAHAGIDPELLRAARESEILQDAFHVQEGRKRQLGKGLP